MIPLFLFFRLKCYTDLSYVGDGDTASSQSGGLFLRGRLDPSSHGYGVTWKVRREFNVPQRSLDK